MITVISILSILIAFLCFIPLLDAEHWTVRGQEYVKILYLFFAILLIIFTYIYLEPSILKYALLALNVISIGYCLNKFIPLTPLFPIQLKQAENIKPERQIKIIVFNVWQKNDNYNDVAKFLIKENADIVFLLETNAAWDQGLQSVSINYPYKVKAIREDTYGLILMSNLDVVEKQINHIVTNQIPSMELEINFIGKKIRVYGLHPKPPIFGESIYSSKKDKEFREIAKIIKSNNDKYAHLAIGDFNEVSWGRTFKNLWKKAELNDPRRGRFYKPTFPSYLPIRIPLDHVLCSNEFEYVNFKVGDNMGSDHYPIIVTLQLK